MRRSKRGFDPARSIAIAAASVVKAPRSMKNATISERMARLNRSNGGFSRIDYFALVDAATHRALLDAFAGAADLGRKFGEQFRNLNSLAAECAALAADESALEREVDLLRYQVREIEAAELRA